ncbi:MAG: hypothetical protein M1379_14240 [Firmicutes bacterium]|nr:hypothetical protein [Bacillota bacterium]
MEKEYKPSFTRDQVVNTADVQRKWRSVIQPKVDKMPFVLVFSGSEPKTAVISYKKFEELWQKAAEASELELQHELLNRLLLSKQDSSDLTSLKDLAAKAGLTVEDLEASPDVDLEVD